MDPSLAILGTVASSLLLVAVVAGLAAGAYLKGHNHGFASAERERLELLVEALEARAVEARAAGRAFGAAVAGIDSGADDALDGLLSPGEDHSSAGADFPADHLAPGEDQPAPL